MPYFLLLEIRALDEMVCSVSSHSNILLRLQNSWAERKAWGTQVTVMNLCHFLAANKLRFRPKIEEAGDVFRSWNAFLKPYVLKSQNTADFWMCLRFSLCEFREILMWKMIPTKYNEIQVTVWAAFQTLLLWIYEWINSFKDCFGRTWA